VPLALILKHWRKHAASVGLLPPAVIGTAAIAAINIIRSARIVPSLLDFAADYHVFAWQ
jgi:hypothetical protein